MTRTIAVLTFAAFTAAPALAAPIVHGPPAATDAVVAAEKAFSDRFARTTVADGMRGFIADDGRACGGGERAPGPAAAFAACGGDAAPTTLHRTWVPAEVFAAASGDMAASWGRFTMTDGAGKMPPFTGHYVTVWTRTAGGGWKALMDIGSPDAPPPPPPGR